MHISDNLSIVFKSVSIESNRIVTYDPCSHRRRNYSVGTAAVGRQSSHMIAAALVSAAAAESNNNNNNSSNTNNNNNSNNSTTLPYFFINSSLSLFGGGGGGGGVGNGSGALNASDIEGPVFPSYIRTTSMIFCIVILGIGVIGNIMVPLVILKSKDMRNSTNIFLMNLSIADLMVLLVCTPTVLVEVNSKPETWVLGEEMCK